MNDNRISTIVLTVWCLLICTKIASSLLPKNDNKVIIAEAIFNSLLRYGAAVFLKPIYDKEDLNMEKNQKILLPFKHFRTIC